MRLQRATAVAAVLVIAAGCGTGEEAEVAPTAVTSTPAAQAASALPTVTVHKTESCECCGQYETYLAERGVDVEVVVHDDVAPVKQSFGVPDSERSCHTNEVAGYFVEGHVPVEAITALLDQQPDVDGIALAGMPSGSPGMPGEQTEPFVVTTSVDGEVAGVLGEF